MAAARIWITVAAAAFATGCATSAELTAPAPTVSPDMATEPQPAPVRPSPAVYASGALELTLGRTGRVERRPAEVVR